MLIIEIPVDFAYVFISIFVITVFLIFETNTITKQLINTSEKYNTNTHTHAHYTNNKI